MRPGRATARVARRLPRRVGWGNPHAWARRARRTRAWAPRRHACAPAWQRARRPPRRTDRYTFQLRRRRRAPRALLVLRAAPPGLRTASCAFSGDHAHTSTSCCALCERQRGASGAQRRRNAADLNPARRLAARTARADATRAPQAAAAPNAAALAAGRAAGWGGARCVTATSAVVPRHACGPTHLIIFTLAPVSSGRCSHSSSGTQAEACVRASRGGSWLRGRATRSCCLTDHESLQRRMSRSTGVQDESNRSST